MSLLSLDKTVSGNSIEVISPAYLSSLEPDPILAFRGLGIKDTTYATHGYHRYPAKFIPQLASRLIEEYSREGDTVADIFFWMRHNVSRVKSTRQAFFWR